LGETVGACGSDDDPRSKTRNRLPSSCSQHHLLERLFPGCLATREVSLLGHFHGVGAFLECGAPGLERLARHLERAIHRGSGQGLGGEEMGCDLNGYWCLTGGKWARLEGLGSVCSWITQVYHGLHCVILLGGKIGCLHPAGPGQARHAPSRDRTLLPSQAARQSGVRGSPATSVQSLAG